MQARLLIVVFFVSVWFSIECIAQSPYYKPEWANWRNEIISGNAKHTIYLIGDAGESNKSRAEGLKILGAHLEKESKASTVIFLGDNSYPSGVPEKSSPEREAAEINIEAQLKVVKEFRGNIFFVPGNHDWDRWSKTGWAGVMREEEYIEKELNRGNVVLPDLGCPGPVEVLLSDRLLLILIDTQWWLHEWSKPAGDKNGCTINNEIDFISQLRDIIRDNSDKQILIAGHHPLYSNGNHGGQFALKDHIFPLTAARSGLYIPLPVIGSIYPFSRKFISPIQDINHPRYQLLKKKLLQAFEDHDNLIFAAGHEHSLQYFNKQNQHFIVSGSGSKATYVDDGKGAGFAYARQGFSKVIYMESGEVWIEYWTITNAEEDVGEVVFRKKIKEKDEIKLEPEERIIDFRNRDTTIMAGENFSAGKFKKIFLGQHYRQAWLAPVKVDFIDIRTEQGGLTPKKLGGGFQTKSLRLEDANGTEYVFRSIQKYPKKVLPEELRNTWVGDIVEDQISMAHPYGAFVIPDLAKAAGVYHKQARLVYVPDDPALGKYQSVFKNTLALFEERTGENLAGYANMGEGGKAIATPDLIKELHQSHHNIVDEIEVLRNRLFDMWVGDWDRHDDQWRWVEFDCHRKEHTVCYHVKHEKTGKGKIYQPIPRDRDQVFVQLDGAIPWLVRRKWAAPRLAHFDHEIENLEGLNMSGRVIDKTFLTRLSEEEWVTMAQTLQANLTDEVIVNAFKVWPDTIMKLNGDEIISKLKSRRNDLVKYAREYYRMLAEEVEIVGSDKEETFEVERKPNGNTVVKVYRKKKDNRKESLFYEREFKFSETKEIRLYGLGDDDRFELTGEAHKGIRIRIIGGKGDDKIIDHSVVHGWRRHTKVYDNITGVKIDGSKETKEVISNNKYVNTYVRKIYKPDVVTPVIRMGFNVDDGYFVGGGITSVKQGWQKIPYKRDHKIGGAVAAKTGAFIFGYEGNFYQIYKDWALSFGVVGLAPNAATNFYGLGNETEADIADPNFYLVRFDQWVLHAEIKKEIGTSQLLKIGPRYEYINVEKTDDRFISSPEADLPPSAFEATQFMGLQISYSINSTDNNALPTKGVKWNSEVNWLYNSESQRGFSNFKSDLSFFFTLNAVFKPTFALRFGGATIFDDFEFYQANTLGAQTIQMGKGNLRGYHRDRFSGRSTLFQNTELRLKLFNFQSYLFPGQFGIHGFVDHGRAWIDDEVSETWHRSYGGGVWLSPLQKLVLTVAVEKSKEDRFITFHLNFLF